MKLEVNVDKKYFFAFVLIGLIFIGIVGVIAYNSVPAIPANFGHSVGEIEWSQTIQGNVTVNGSVNAAGFCIGTSCKTDWSGLGVIYTAGDGVTIVNNQINATGIGIIPTRTSNPTNPVIGQMWLINP